VGPFLVGTDGTLGKGAVMRHHRYDETAAAPKGVDVGPGRWVRTQAPARAAGLVSDVAVPFLQSLLTGVLLGGVVSFVVSRSQWGGDVGILFVGLVLVVACLCWLVLLGQHRALLWATERLTGQDLDGDRQLGKPRERLVVVNAERERRSNEGAAQEARVSQFVDFVSRLPMRGTSLRAWEKHLGRDVYCEYRDVLFRLGWAAWRSDDQRQGWELVVPVEHILTRVRVRE